jgi:transcriptional repressor NrdR
MICPFCGAHKDQLKVIDSRSAEAGEAIRRRRECTRCEKRFTTYERIELAVKLTVVKRDGRRSPWDRQKILDGLERACYKRAVPEAALEKISEDVEDEAQRVFDKEVPSDWLGKQVMKRLRELDEVAYVRFASVYHRFKTVDELLGEVRAVMESEGHDPGQGELFEAARRRSKK